ncbi:hypothetical protein PAXINDRAFT_13224 [Paxillus involutus ATCC 200175]|uniref:Uncharacterized protein n=1 Tax=Paxillus involutus ATCC 200175 TaxID=664439 RepID=A0A0C9SWF7_PAXIN|nr:hypothetical protein PAXINDRAFT_13224 [Paxillus involutus ATCC 200175]
MHWVLYCAVGKNYQLLEGLLYLFAFATGFQKLSAAQSSVKIRYGEPQRWKRITANINRTKPQRAPEARARQAKKGDGRPPDTSKELLTKTKAGASKSKQSAEIGMRPSYPWKDNSCWLDSSLELIYTVASKQFYTSFLPRFQTMSRTHPLWNLYEAIDFRMTLVDLEQATSMLGNQRDNLRKVLKHASIIKSLSDKGSLFSWLATLLKYRQDQPDGAHMDARSYFETHTVVLRLCDGTATTPCHWQLTTPARASTLMFQLNSSNADLHGGDLEKWLRDVVRINKQPTPSINCWRTSEGTPLCNGSASSLTLYVHLPVMLIIEAGDHTDVKNRWNAPATLRPLSSSHAEAGVIYDIAGVAYFDPTADHFVARFTPDSKKVFHYDGMRHSGVAMLIKGATITSHLTGYPNRDNCPDGCSRHAFVYQLRGGTKAQEIFGEHQSQQALRLYDIIFAECSEGQDHIGRSLPHISLGKNNIKQLLPEDLKWLRNPSRAKTVDYEQVIQVPSNADDHDQPLSSPSQESLAVMQVSQVTFIQSMTNVAG